MDENELKLPVEGYHRFVLIVSMATGIEKFSLHSTRRAGQERRLRIVLSLAIGSDLSEFGVDRAGIV